MLSLKEKGHCRRSGKAEMGVKGVLETRAKGMSQEKPVWMGAGGGVSRQETGEGGATASPPTGNHPGRDPRLWQTVRGKGSGGHTELSRQR